MAKKRISTMDKIECPETLQGHPFYGLELDEEQQKFRDCIYSKDYDIIFCNAKAGSGKTLIAVGTANLMVQYGMYDGIVYIAAPVQEAKQGFLPGGIEEKSEPYYEPCYQALDKIGVNMNTATFSDITNEKFGTAYIKCMVHTYMRGCNFENKVVILDESQNLYFDEMKKVLTRMHDSCKVIVIGHAKQCDIYYNPERSGFMKYLNHFSKHERCAVCELTTNHRGWISNTADELE